MRGGLNRKRRGVARCSIPAEPFPASLPSNAGRTRTRALEARVPGAVVRLERPEERERDAVGEDQQQDGELKVGVRQQRKRGAPHRAPLRGLVVAAVSAIGAVGAARLLARSGGAAAARDGDRHDGVGVAADGRRLVDQRPDSRAGAGAEVRRGQPAGRGSAGDAGQARRPWASSRCGQRRLLPS